jgi:hypothetical protein
MTDLPVPGLLETKSESKNCWLKLSQSPQRTSFHERAKKRTSHFIGSLIFSSKFGNHGKLIY